MLVVMWSKGEKNYNLLTVTCDIFVGVNMRAVQLFCLVFTYVYRSNLISTLSQISEFFSFTVIDGMGRLDRKLLSVNVQWHE